MKDAPILFSGPMVRAILDGRKTVTRRIACSGRGELHSFDGEVATFGDSIPDDPLPLHVRCRFAPAGRRLWVRETWVELAREHRTYLDTREFAYRASCEVNDRSGDGERCRQDYIEAGYPYRWKPSIHMPRDASRITLEVVSVRVERLRDISEEDACAEGITEFDETAVDPRSWFAMLWDQINAKRASWASNPWIWRVEFRRLGES